MFRRVLLALIPVALLTTASLAFTQLYDPFDFMKTPAPSETVAQTDDATPPPPPATTEITETKKDVAQAPAPDQAQPQAADEPEKIAQEIKQIEDEPLPVLVVDKTPLTQAMLELDKAMEQAKLAVTALDADAQQRYIQESINLLAGSEDVTFRLLAGTYQDYKGVRPLLVQARVIREAAEVQWIAAVQQQLEARAKRLAEIAQAGGNGTVPSSKPPVDLQAVVGPTGVLGTRGVRPEEQAHDIVTRALKEAVEALRVASSRPQQPTLQDGGLTQNHASDEATAAMESVVKMLETAKKIMQIAADR